MTKILFKFEVVRLVSKCAQRSNISRRILEQMIEI
jgi:hypothetical protein